MKEFAQKYLPWILVVILIIILIFFRSCSCGSVNSGKDTDLGEQHGNDTGISSKRKIRAINDISKSNPKTIKSPTTTTLNAIHRKGAGVYLTVGDNGEVWITPNGGLNWIRGKGTGTQNLYGAAVLSFDVMIAVGNNGTIIRSKDKGLNWDTVTSHTANTIRSVSFPDFNNGYAVGDNGLILKTADAGVTWSIVPFSPSTLQINSVCFINSTTGWFAGKGGALYKTISAGGNWTKLDSLNLFAGNNFNCISFNSLERGTAVGDNGIIINTVNGGITWIASSHISGNDLKAVHRVSNILSYVAGNGIMYRENNGIYLTIEQISANKYNAVDPSPYISGISVGLSGIMTGVNTILCEDCNVKGNHDVMFLPPEGGNDTLWKVRLRIYSNSSYDFKRYLRVITPGFHMDHTVFSGWTQNDNLGIQDPIAPVSQNATTSRLNYSSITSPATFNSIPEDEIDAATLDMDQMQGGYLELNLMPITGNTFDNGTVEFYFGKDSGPDTSFCYRVTYTLGEDK